jgi:hypothetical protein
MTAKTHSIATTVIWFLFAGFTPCFATNQAADQPEEKILQERLNSMQNLKKLGTALMLYSGDHNETFPGNIAELRPYLDSNMVWIFNNVQYRKIAVASRPDTPMAFDKTMFAKGNGTVVLYNDGHVEFVKPDKLTNMRILQSFFGGTSPNIGSLCGHITDAQTGQPVIDATIHMNMQVVPVTHTDANGFYLIENLPAGPNFRISVDSNEYVGITDYQSMPSIRIQKDTQAIQDFKLDKACMIQVQVVDEANQPVEGAELSVMPFDREIQRKLMTGIKRYNLQTNKDGIALLGGLIPSKMGYQVFATHSTNIESLREDGTKTSTKQQDYAPGKLLAILNSTEFLESGRIILQKGDDVKGRAIYEDGAPATDVNINASRSYVYGNLRRSYFHGSSPVDANGNFTLRHIVPDFYYISASKPAGKEGPVSIADLQTNLPLADKGELTINIPLKSSQPLVSIRGKLTFTNSVPDNVYISASSSDGKYYSNTDWQKSGKDACDTNFVIDRLVPAKYNLSFSSSYIKQKTVENVDAPSEDLEIKLETFERFPIIGTVVNSQTGEPIQSFKARVKQVQSFRSMPTGGWQDMNYKDGSFCVEAIGAGIYQVQIAADGFAWTDSPEINTSQNAPVVIKLSRGGTIKGMVVNDAGQPIDGVKIIPMSKAREMTPTGLSFSEQDTAVTVNGVFELNNITAGMESIKAIYTDYPPSIVDNIVVKEGQTTEGIKIVLSKGATVEGYVYDSAGLPQAGTALIFQNSPYYNWSEEKSGQIATATTDENGYYRAEGLPEKICFVSLPKERNATGVTCRAFVPAKGKVSRYDFGGQPVVKGRVVFDGKPLTDYSMDLTTTERTNSAVFQCFAKSGPNGEFTFGGVPKGKWSIYCVDPENKSKMLKIANIDTDGRDTDTGVIPKGLSTLSVSTEYEPGESKWNITEVFLQYEDIPWGQPISMLEKPSSDNEPYIARNIMAGRYRLILNRGHITLQRIIDIVEGNTDITVRIPKGGASVRGKLVTNYPDWQALWREGHEVVCYLKPDANGNYEFNNLPPGKYNLSPDMLANRGKVLTFELAQGEQKVLDIDTSNMQKTRTGFLQVFVLDEYGIPITTADVYLEGNKDTIKPIFASAPAFHFNTDPGPYTLMIKTSGYREIKQPVEVKIWDFQTTKRKPDPLLIWLEK